MESAPARLTRRPARTVDRAEDTPSLVARVLRELGQSFLAADCAARPREFDTLFQTLWQGFAEPSAWQLVAGAREALVVNRDGIVVEGTTSNIFCVRKTLPARSV